MHCSPAEGGTTRERILTEVADRVSCVFLEALPHGLFLALGDIRHLPHDEFFISSRRPKAHPCPTASRHKPPPARGVMCKVLANVIAPWVVAQSRIPEIGILHYGSFVGTALIGFPWKKTIEDDDDEDEDQMLNAINLK